MNICDYSYCYPTGQFLADTNHNVPLSDRFIDPTPGVYTRCENHWDSSVTWTKWTGEVIPRERLPWVAEQSKRDREQRAVNGKSRLAAMGASVTRSGSTITIRIDCNSRQCQIDEVRAAAEQRDTGDGLVPFYRAVLDAIGAQ